MIGALATADFRERSRRPAYAVVLLAAVALGVLALPAAGSHWQIFQLGDYRGRYSSAYAGMVTALAGAVWLSLAGFHVVKNAVALDVGTGVGQILAATPLRRAPYLAGKFVGNLAVLASMTAALAATALVMQLWRGEDRHVSPVALLAPFVLITLPALALTAAAAVLFETVPGLRSGTGNIVWLFLWMTGSIGLQSGGGLDVFGLGHVVTSMRTDVVHTFGDHRPFDFGIGLVERDIPLKVFAWSGSYVMPASSSSGSCWSRSRSPWPCWAPCGSTVSTRPAPCPAAAPRPTLPRRPPAGSSPSAAPRRRPVPARPASAWSAPHSASCWPASPGGGGPAPYS
jgi:hypothetical protein